MKLTTEDTEGTERKKRRVYNPPDDALTEFDALVEDLMDYTGDGLVTDDLLDKIRSKHRQRHLQNKAA